MDGSYSVAGERSQSLNYLTFAPSLARELWAGKRLVTPDVLAAAPHKAWKKVSSATGVTGTFMPAFPVFTSTGRTTDSTRYFAPGYVADEIPGTEPDLPLSYIELPSFAYRTRKWIVIPEWADIVRWLERHEYPDSLTKKLASIPTLQKVRGVTDSWDDELMLMAVEYLLWGGEEGLSAIEKSGNPLRYRVGTDTIEYAYRQMMLKDRPIDIFEAGVALRQMSVNFPVETVKWGEFVYALAHMDNISSYPNQKTRVLEPARRDNKKTIISMLQRSVTDYSTLMWSALIEKERMRTAKGGAAVGWTASSEVPQYAFDVVNMASEFLWEEVEGYFAAGIDDLDLISEAARHRVEPDVLRSIEDGES